MKTTTRRRIGSALLALCLMLCMLSGCGKHDEAIEQRIKEFVLRCNELDIDGILRSLDPAIAEPAAIVISGIERLSKLNGTPIDKYEMFSSLSGFLMDEAGIDALPFFESIAVEVVKIEMDGSNYAYAYSNISYAIADIKFTKEGVIHMVEQADTWYVSWLEFGIFE